MNYLDIGEVIIIHDELVEFGGGRKGVSDYRLVHSSVERPKSTFAGQPLYPTLTAQAAAMIHSLIKNHPFNDGNKRTGFFSMLRFLNINGKDISATKEEIIVFTLDIDIKRLSLQEIEAWIKKHLVE